MTIRPQPTAHRRRLALLLATALLGACGAADRPGDPHGTATAVVALSADISGINPLTASGTIAREIHDQLFLRLFEELADYAEHPPSFAPELVEDHEWSPDGLGLTLRLRSDARWSDGRPITADDVVWTLDARADPDLAWAGAQSNERLAGWRALDATTVEVRFRSVYPDRLADLNESPILPRHAWGRVPLAEWRQRDDWFRSHLVTSGPFVLASWRPGRELVLERNPLYFRRGRPRLERVVFLIVPEKANQLEELLSGRIDFVTGLAPVTAERVEKASHTRIESFWHRQYAYIGWNACRPPFDDPVVRRALTMALDRRAMLEAIYLDYARLAVSPILSSIWAFHDGLEPWPHDPDRSRRLLASRGWIDRDGDGVVDRDGVPLSFRLSTVSTNRMRVDAVTMAREYFAAVGVEARIELQEFETWRARNESHDFDASLGTWLIDTALDPHYVFHSDSIEGRGNWGCYRSSDVDRLIDSARDQTEAAGKLPYLLEIQEILHRDQPYTFLFELKRLDGVSRRLRDVRPNSLRTFANLEEWWIADGERAVPAETRESAAR